uniref:Uncharacterized protein n=1 Tax=Cacopsylla melanoneura TaxID=428564 RepID=A0A8D8VG83_9HEMI
MKSIILLLVLASQLGTREAYKVRNILVVIDTDRLEKDYHNETRRLDPEKPTTIEDKYAFMITTNENVVSGQATAKLHIKGLVGDKVKWFGTSVSNDIDVIVYNITHGSDKVSEVRRDIFGKKYAYPKKKNIEDIGFVYFKYFELDVLLKERGEANYNIRFAVYNTTLKSSQRELLFGYFEWDPKITIE